MKARMRLINALPASVPPVILKFYVKIGSTLLHQAKEYQWKAKFTKRW